MTSRYFVLRAVRIITARTIYRIVFSVIAIIALITIIIVISVQRGVLTLLPSDILIYRTMNV